MSGLAAEGQRSGRRDAQPGQPPPSPSHLPRLSPSFFALLTVLLPRVASLPPSPSLREKPSQPFSASAFLPAPLLLPPLPSLARIPRFLPFPAPGGESSASRSALPAFPSLRTFLALLPFRLPAFLRSFPVPPFGALPSSLLRRKGERGASLSLFSASRSSFRSLLRPTLAKLAGYALSLSHLWGGGGLLSGPSLIVAKEWHLCRSSLFALRLPSLLNRRDFLPSSGGESRNRR